MAVLGMLVACGSAAAPDDIEAAALTAHRGSARVIDVRTPEEFRAGHVPGAENFPLGSYEVAELGLKPGEEVFVICKSGGRSARAAAQLDGAGFQARNVLGGTDQWVAAGGEVEQ